MSDKKKLDEIIQKLELKPHPEGGYFRETYRCKGEIPKDCLGSEFSDKRNFSTCIYFLLTSDSFSAFHRIKQDEIWHFYYGSPICLHIINKEGVYSKVIIGNDFLEGQIPQFIVPAGDWFAATVLNSESFSLMGCTVSPGFDFDDFELPLRSELVTLFPEHKEIITELTWK